MSESGKTISNFLAENGYEKFSSGHDVVWKLTNNEPNSSVDCQIEILERKNQFHICKCKIHISPEKVSQKIIKNIKKRFRRLISHKTFIEHDGRIKTIIQVENSPDVRHRKSVKETPRRANMGCAIGWTTVISQTNAVLAVQLTDSFQIGDAPANWWADLVASVSEAIAPFSLKAWETRHLREIHIPIAALGSRNLKAKSYGRPTLELADMEVPIPLKLTSSATEILIETSTRPSIQHDHSLEILEARETALIWQAFDNKILQRKDLSFVETLPAQDCDLLPRFATKPELKLRESEQLRELADITQTNATPLALTGAIQLATQKELHNQKIELLSQLIRKIAIIYGAIDTIEPLEKILPEALGDAWAPVNPQMAYLAWEASSQITPMSPRIHKKMANLACKNGDAEKELDCLLKILSSERRKSEVASTAQRVVEIIRHHTDLLDIRRDEICHSLERALSLIPDHPKLGHGIADILANMGKHREALSALDHILINKAPDLDVALISDINFSMARIWFQKEGNLKIATARYKNATSEVVKLSDELLEEAENFFTSTGNMEEAQRILLMRSQQSDPTSRLRALDRSLKLHAENGNLEAAVSDVLKLLASGLVQPSFLDILEKATKQKTTDKKSIITAMLAADLSPLSKEDHSKWRLIAARSASSFDDLKSQAFDIMREGRIIPLLTAEESYAVIEHLIREDKNNQASEFISCRLSFTQPKENEKLLNYIVQHNLSSMDGLYENALAEHAASSLDLSMAKKRIRNQVAQNKSSELNIMLRTLQSALVGRTELTQIQDFVIDEICASGSQILSELLEDLSGERLNTTSTDKPTTNSIIELIIKSGFINLGTRLLINEINKGNACIQDEAVVGELLESDIVSLAKWCEARRQQETDKSRRVNYAKKSIELWMASNERPELLIELFLEVNESEALSIQNLELLEYLCSRYKRIDTWLEITNSLIFKSSAEDRLSLIHWFIRVLNSRLDRPELAAEYCLKWWDNQSTLDFEQLFTIGILYFQADSLVSAQAYLLRILNNPEVLTDHAILLASLDTLSRCRLDRAHFATVTQTLLSWSRAGGYEPLTEELVNRSIEWHVAENDDLNQRFSHNFDNETPDRLAIMATQIITRSERSGTNIARLISAWFEQIKSNQQLSKWRDMMALLNQDRFLGQLKRSSRIEVIHAYARHLFTSDETRLDSVPIFEALANENPMDNRYWIPLYSLYEETGTRQKLIAHLEHIIPLLHKDRSVLEHTPFTLESLKNSLKRARASVRGPVEINFERAAVKRREDFDIQERAAQMQKSWIAASPAVQISMPVFSQDDEVVASALNQIRPHDQSASSGQFFDSSAAISLASDQTSDSFAQFLDSSDTKQFDSTTKTSALSKPDDDGQTGRVTQIDWRDLIVSEKVAPGSTERIMTMAFASDIEKHVAVQCVALINGEMRPLDAWHWQAWRNPESCDYSQSPKGRLPDLENLKHYGGALHKLLRLISPILTRVAHRRFMIETKLQELGLSVTTDMNPVDFDHPIIERCCLSYFKAHLNLAKIKFMDTPGMGTHVFFDLRTKAIHFDANWQAKLPRTVLANKIIEILVANQRGQATLIDLNPVTDVIPIIDEISSVLTSAGLARLQIAFGVQHREINHELRGINREQLVSLLSIAGKPSMRDIKQLQHEMRLKNLATVLASTLDVVGLLESISGQDLSETGVLKPKSVLQIHPLVKDILLLATKLTI